MVYDALVRFYESDTQPEGVVIVEAELDFSYLWSPDDPDLLTQNHYDAINLKAAWDATKGSGDFVVQVLDTGVEIAHPDLVANIWTNKGEICGNGIDDDNNGFVDDCHGYNHADDTGDDLMGNHWHGTHCAGTIAAETNNGVGVAGVAGGDGKPGSGGKLMTGVVFGRSGHGGFAEAIVYGANNGAKISSNSWGYSWAGLYDQAELDAIDYVNEKDGIVVFAAGNAGEDDEYYPAYYDGAGVLSTIVHDDDWSYGGGGYYGYGYGGGGYYG